MSSEDLAALPAGSVVYRCPLAACPWTFAQSPPGGSAPVSVAPGATLEESISRGTLAILQDWYAEAERAIEPHLATHTTLEWVTEINRLREGAAGNVAVKREDLERVHDYARHFDVDEDPAMVRVAEVLRGSERRPGSSLTGAA